MSETHEAAVVRERTWMKALRTAGVPLLSVLFAMLIGSIILVASGKDPLLTFGALLKGSFGSPDQWQLGNFRALGDTLSRATPLVFAGLAVAFGFRANLFNIGANGQLLLGSVAAAWLGLVLGGLPGLVAVPLILIGAALAGAAWAFIPGILKAKVGAHEVITTMMFSWIALYLTSWIISGPLKDATANSQTPVLPQSVWLPTFDTLFPWLFRVPVGAHLGFLIAVALAVLVWWILKKTTLGYSVRAVGFNPTAAQTGGISIATTTVWALCISGALAGLAGASQVLGVQHRMFDEVSAASGFGFTGIAVALLAKNHPIAVIFAAILFGALQAGSGMMQLVANVPDKIITIVQALIIFFVGAETIITWLIKRRQKLALEEKGEGDVA
ncbi:MAG TPA: ABC transporter permease [Coriobacteriia bacterium]